MRIGLAFLVRDKIYNLEIIKKFISQLDHEVLISIHSKQNFRSPFDKANFIKPIKTEWGTSSLVIATNLLFQDLFSKNCDVVYLMSGDMIPLDPCVQFVNNNSKTHIKLQDMSQASDKLKSATYGKYDRICSEDFKNKVHRSSFVKQNMFFCISKNDFLRLNFDAKIEDDLFPCIANPLSRRCLDEFFWANTMIYKNINFTNNPKYIYCNSKSVRTQASNFKKIPQDADGFLFLRKIKTTHSIL